MYFCIILQLAQINGLCVRCTLLYLIRVNHMVGKPLQAFHHVGLQALAALTSF